MPGTTRRSGAPLSDDLGEAGYSELYDRSAVPTFTLDHERRAIVRVNPAALRLLGLDEAQVLGRPATDFLLERASDQVLRSRDAHDEHTVVVREIRTSRGSRTVELHVVPSGVAGVAFIQAVDLTDVLDAARRAELRAAELAEQRATLESIATRLAHDLRGPMGTIAGMADLLARPDRLDEGQQAELLGRVSATARALIAMTDSILDEAGGPLSESDSSSHRVEDLFASLRAVVEAQLAEVAGVLATSTEVEDLPVPIGAVRHAVLNLVSNSIKYREPSRPLEVDVTVRTAAGATEIVVRDNGQGLPEDSSRLFELGERGPTSDGTPGAGLGLAFARDAVERLGGTLTARALPAGAELTVSIPSVANEQVSTTDEGLDDESRFSAAQLERILDASPIATIVIDVAIRQVVRINNAGVRLLGDREEVLGRPAADFLDGGAVADALREQVIAGAGVARAADLVVKTRGGPRRADVWVAAVEGTSLAIAHLVERDPGAS